MMYLLICFWVSVLVPWTDGIPSLDVVYTPKLCVKSNATCAADGSCTMIYIPNNTSYCSEFQHNDLTTEVNQLSLGRIELDTYIFGKNTIAQQIAFNITFQNISWTNMRFSISLSGKSDKRTCREFVRQEDSAVKNLSYDCLWSNERYEGKPHILEYEARSGDIVENAQFSFNVPFAPNLFNSSATELQILVYVESIASPFGRTTFILHWKPLSEQFDVNSYQVLEFCNETNEETFLMEIKYCQDGMCSFTTTKWLGNIRFGVRPIFKNGTMGFISRTPIYILETASARPLLLGIVSCSLILPVIVYILFALRNFIFRHRKPSAPVKILLIYTPSTTPHLRMVEALAKYLNKLSNVTALMDELDIPISIGKDPFTWCSDAMLSADIVLVVASPYHNSLRSTAALYRTDRLLLRLLRERYGTGGKTRFCVVMPKYSTITDVPHEAAALRRYRLPEDLDLILHLARFPWPFISWCIPLDQSVLPENKELADCLAAADADFRCNSVEYSRQAQQVLETMSKEESYFEKLNQPKCERKLPPWDPFEGKAEGMLEAKQVLGDFPGNLDSLNLFGESELAPMVPVTVKVDSHFNLDHLNL